MEDPQDAPTREKKADLVQDLAVVFVGAFTGCFGEQMATLYCHHSMDHIPSMVRRLPMNLSDLSQQGFEALMKQGKNDGAFGNKKLRDDTCDIGRNQQMLQTERVRKRIKQNESMPKSRNEKRMLGGTKEMYREATVRVDSAVRRGVLPSRSKQETDKRISKQEGALATILEDFQLEVVRDTDSPLDEGVPPAQEAPLVDPFAPHLESGLQAPLSAAATTSSENMRPLLNTPFLTETGSGRGMTRLSDAAADGGPSAEPGREGAATAAAGRGGAATAGPGRGAASAVAAAVGRGGASAAAAGKGGPGTGAAAAAPVAGRGAPSRGT
jgi:hypothetical protein